MRPEATKQSGQSGGRCGGAALAAVTALDLVGVPAALLGAAGRVLASNRRLERLIPAVVRKNRDRLQLANAAADALLDAALSQFGRATKDDVCLIPVPQSGALPPMIVRVSRLTATVRELVPPALVMFVIIILDAAKAPPLAVIQGLFNMTPAEARVAQAMAQRHTVAAIASRLGLSRETVRSQRRAALVKAHCARNIDFAVMLANIGFLFDRGEV